MRNFIVISRCEDEARVEILSEKKLKDQLDDGDYSGYTFLDSLPDSDLNYFPSESVFIMEGKVVVPEAVTEVTKYRL